MKKLALSWLAVTSLAIDIETETQARPDAPQIVHGIKQYGLSALAPITHISFYHPDLGSLVLDMRDYNPYQVKAKAASEVIKEKWDFVYQVLCRPDVLIIGHNVLFDLRGIGVQYNHYKKYNLIDAPDFYLPLGAKVWDTETIAKRMLIGETYSKHSSFHDNFDLLSLAQRLEIGINLKTFAFVEWMKRQRADLSSLATTLANLSATDEVIWDFLGGYIPSNRRDLLEEAAGKMLDTYVAFDAQTAYNCYRKELEIAELLAKDDVKLGKFLLQKYPELTQGDIHPEFASHLDYWTRYLRIAGNRTIKGLRVNFKHLRQEQKKARVILRENEALLAQSRDSHDPYEVFESVIGHFFYIEMLVKKLAVVTGQSSVKHTFSKNIKDEWHFWKPIRLSPLVIKDALIFPEGMTDSEIQDWVDFLNHEPYDDIKLAQVAAPKSRVPVIDLFAWVKRNCYHAYSEPHASLLAKSKLDWLREYFTTRRSELRADARKYYAAHPSRSKTDDADVLAEGERLFRERMTNSKKWIPYYLYCISRSPLPSSNDFKYQEGMITGAAKKHIEAFKKLHGSDPEDLQAFIIEKHLGAQAISYGKAALAFYLTDPIYKEQTQQLAPLRFLMQARADLGRLREFQQHAALDGRVHSLLKPDAKTGRNKSTNPNLQNIKMKFGSPYPGLFIAPRGYHFNSADYSNAEVRLGNLLGKDDYGAAAAEDNDYHSVMAGEFWPDFFPELTGELRKLWRNFSKRITFGSNYGSGKVKTALMLRCSVEKAKEVLDNKKRVLWRTEEAKKLIQDNARKRMERGILPVFVTLWSKERVQADRSNYNGHLEMVGYPTWNYVVQGGITAMIRRADVLMTEKLEREGRKTFIQMDIHDELLFAVHKDEYWSEEVLPPCLEIMNSIMPEEYTERTIPKTHFIAEFGPENHRKWGYRSDRKYPWPLDHFISQWGHQPLPEEILSKPEAEREAPTWIGPKHLGWTLEAETAAILEKRRMQALLNKSLDQGVASASKGNHWVDLQEVLCQAEENRLVLELLQPKELIYIASNGSLQNSGLLPFSAWMASIHTLYHRGKPSAYCDTLVQLEKILQTYPAGQAWLQTNAYLLKVIHHA